MVLVWFWCYFLTKKPFATQQSQHDIIPLRKRKIDGFVTCNSSPVGDAFWHVQYPFFQCYPIEIMLMFFLFWIRHNIHIYIYTYIYIHYLSFDCSMGRVNWYLQVFSRVAARIQPENGEIINQEISAGQEIWEFPVLVQVREDENDRKSQISQSDKL